MSIGCILVILFVGGLLTTQNFLAPGTIDMAVVHKINSRSLSFFAAVICPPCKYVHGIVHFPSASPCLFLTQPPRPSRQPTRCCSTPRVTLPWSSMCTEAARLSVMLPMVCGCPEACICRGVLVGCSALTALLFARGGLRLQMVFHASRKAVWMSSLGSRAAVLAKPRLVYLVSPPRGIIGMEGDARRGGAFFRHVGGSQIDCLVVQTRR
jgi:hypothetical protein